MRRPTIRRTLRAGVTALTVAALTTLGACGGGGDEEEDASGPCKDAVYKRYDVALVALEASDAGKSSEDLIADFQKAIGDTLPTECEKVPDIFARGIAEQVSIEYNDKIGVALAKIKGLPDEDSSAEPDESADPEESAEPDTSAEPDSSAEPTESADPDEE